MCGLDALIEVARDDSVDEFPVGTCVVCSYAKSVAIADFEGRNEIIRGAVEDPRR